MGEEFRRPGCEKTKLGGGINVKIGIIMNLEMFMQGKNRVLARLSGIQLYLQSNPSSMFHFNLERHLQPELL